MGITEEATRAAYAYAKKVYNGDSKRINAIEYLVTHHDLNANSAADLLNNFKYMLEGKKYSRTNNEYTTDYYLKSILTDYGQEALRKALNAVAQHIEYYEHSQSITMHKTRVVLKKFKMILDNFSGTYFPDEIPNPNEIFEGAKKQVTVNAYERNVKARQKCIEHYGSECSVCGFDFEGAYGERGKDFIHVHHLVQISSIGKEYQVNPIEDLRPVCPNCHAMIHRNPLFTIDQLKSCLAKWRQSVG
jgi:5-methylcytosine-specific restriction protein A